MGLLWTNFNIDLWGNLYKKIKETTDKESESFTTYLLEYIDRTMKLRVLVSAGWTITALLSFFYCLLLTNYIKNLSIKLLDIKIKDDFKQDLTSLFKYLPTLSITLLDIIIHS